MATGDIWEFYVNGHSEFVEGELLLELKVDVVGWAPQVQSIYHMWSFRTNTMKRILAGPLRNFAIKKYVLDKS